MNDKHHYLRQLPGVDHLLETASRRDDLCHVPKSVILPITRSVLDTIRNQILDGGQPKISEEAILNQVKSLSDKKLAPKLVNVINATGVVLHTNLGRSLLCDEALENITRIAGGYSNLELNITTGKRGIRYAAIEELICDLTGAQSAMAVNNNAGAVLLALNTIAQCRKVIVSRGELVEIGGSFRIPDVMEKSGGILKEVGTTNRTHLRDYENGIDADTGLLLKVHTSNYKIEGFTTSVLLEELVELGKKNNIPVMEDLGSGTLIDFSKFGLPDEPTVRDAVKTGADIITFSGDKLLGGPQAGIIVGKKQAIDEIKKNPLTRALRIDKLTLASLETTLNFYRDEQKALQTIPTLAMLTIPYEKICTKADQLCKQLKRRLAGSAEVETARMTSRPGGGSFPEFKLATQCVTISPQKLSVSSLEKKLRFSNPSIIGRIEDNKYVLDPRTIQDGQDQIIISTLVKVMEP